MVGNWAQSILHGGVIASALDVAAGLVCVGSTLTRHDTHQRRRVAPTAFPYGNHPTCAWTHLRPGRGERFTATAAPCLRAGKVKWRLPAWNRITKLRSILPAQRPPIWWVDWPKSSNITLFGNRFYRWMRNRRGWGSFWPSPPTSSGVSRQLASNLSTMFRRWKF